MKKVFSSQELNSLIQEYQTCTNERKKNDLASVIIESQEGLIYALIHKYFSTYTESNPLFEEMVQMGRIGIFRGLQSFDPEKGRFSTLMGVYIRGEINRFLSESGNTTNHYYYNSRAIEKTRDKLREKGITDPSIADISSESGIPPSTIISSLASESVSRTCGLEEAYNIPATDSFNYSKSIEDEADENIIHEVLINAINRLPKEHRFVVMRAFGLYNGKFYRDTAIAKMGKHLNLDTAKVKRYKLEALKWLRRDYDLVRYQSHDFLSSEDDIDENCFLCLSEELFNGEMEKLEAVEAGDADFDMNCELVSSFEVM